MNVMDPKMPAVPQQISLTPQQLATLLVVEAQIQALQLGANQLGGFLALKEEGDLLISAAEHLAKGLAKMKKRWASGLVVVDAGSRPPEPPRVG